MIILHYALAEEIKQKVYGYALGEKEKFSLFKKMESEFRPLINDF